MVMQDNDGDVKLFAIGSGSTVAGGETAKKRELDTADIDKVFYSVLLLYHIGHSYSLDHLDYCDDLIV